MDEVALVDQDFLNLIDLGNCFQFPRDLKPYVQPASLDLPLSSNCYLVKDKILPFGQNINNLLPSILLDKTNLLLKNQTYLCYCGKINLPSNIYAKCSPKSSIGRIDLLVRTIFDQSGFYDEIEKGASGDLWVQICPRSFNIQIYEGLALTQIMLFEEKKKETKTKNHQIKLHINTQLGGYEAKITNEILDLSKLNHDSSLFFNPILPNSELILEKDKFYIITTIEIINIQPEQSAEMIPFTSHIGEFRCHKAGFFDPGFNAVGVLEICPYETIRVFHGQPIALLNYFQNKRNPLILYGNANNNYQNQIGPQLAKFFNKIKKRSRADQEYQDETNFTLYKFDLLKKEITKLLSNSKWEDHDDSNDYKKIYVSYKNCNGIEFYKSAEKIIDEIHEKDKNIQMHFCILQKILFYRTI